jgi:ATP synthase protein I
MMDELQLHLRYTLKLFMFFTAGCFAMWALFPSVRSIAFGMILGSLASWINAMYLSRKVRTIGDMASSGVSKRMNYGFLTRAAVVVLAVLIASRTNGIDVYGVIAGYLIMQLATLVSGYMTISRGKG